MKENLWAGTGAELLVIFPENPAQKLARIGMKELMGVLFLQEGAEEAEQAEQDEAPALSQSFETNGISDRNGD